MNDSRKQLVELLGGKCEDCKIKDPEVLQLDHKHDDGSEDRSRFKGSAALYVYYLKRPEEAKDRLQVLCANHNWKKRLRKPSLGLTDLEALHELKTTRTPVRRFFSDWTDSVGTNFIVWKDNVERLPPGVMVCRCGYSAWQLLGDLETYDLYLRCPNCGEDRKAVLS